MKFRQLPKLALIASLGFGSLAAQEKEKDKKWNVASPGAPSKNVEFTVSEGTWMNLDVSPDGRDIVFDLLGDIYIMPVTGGEARLLAGGLPYEIQPRFSPDGTKILFTSDREGGDNIWMMDRDGSNTRSVTKESFRLTNNAVWTPDGNYIIARKHYTGYRSLGAGEMWMYHTTGGEGMQLTKRKNDQMDAGEPCISPDGKYVYWSEDMSPGSSFQYNKNPYEQIYVIRRLSRETGEIENYIGGSGGAVRPQVSPDGKYLSFVRRVGLKSVLFAHNFETGEELPIWDGLSKDQQETWAIFGVYPNYSWTPDGKNIIVWAQGKIWNVDVQSGSAKNIPFRANVKQTITEALHFPQKVFSENVDVKMIRHAVTSPDGKTLVFNAAGHLWKKSLPDGKPERLTNDEENHEFEPSFSPDGKEIVYTSWNDSAKGAVRIVSLGKKSGRKLTSEKGFYFSPKFSPDGKKIVFQKDRGNLTLGVGNDRKPGLYWMDAAGGTMNFIQKDGAEPRFNRDGSRIYYSTYEGESKAFKGVNLNGGDERTYFTSKYANSFVPSPDDEWIAFTELFNAYIAPFPKTGKAVDLTAKTGSFPVTRVTRDAGISLHWSGDGRTLHWTIGPEYFSRSIQESFKFVKGAADSILPPAEKGIQIGLSLPGDLPKGKIALKGARIITMKGEQVIENGTVLIDRNMISAVGNSSEISIPSDAKVIDVTGKTIIPGLIDVHAHLGTSDNGISPQQQWQYYANLAYGVTTAHDPSSNTEMVFSQSEMQKVGLMKGPRVYSTGTILYGADGDFKAVVNSLDDARSHLRRLKAVGAFSVKSYNQPRRDQRQQILQAARELEMEVVPEGGSTFYWNMNQIADGHTGIEHSIPVAPLYEDVRKFWNSTNVAYTPTLIVAYGGIMGENYWYQHSNVYDKKTLLNFTPRTIIDSRARRRPMATDDDYSFIDNAKSAKILNDGGTKVQLGAHGQLQGLGAHWELWMLQQGGMTPLQALRAGTLSGAEYLGMERELGSIETGKLADLVVLDKNPLENIQNSETVRYVMQNGRLYDAATMNETGSTEKKRDKFFWEMSGYSNSFDFHYETRSFETPKCGCHVH